MGEKEGARGVTGAVVLGGTGVQELELNDAVLLVETVARQNQAGQTGGWPRGEGEGAVFLARAIFLFWAAHSGWEFAAHLYVLHGSIAGWTGGGSSCAMVGQSVKIVKRSPMVQTEAMA